MKSTHHFSVLPHIFAFVANLRTELSLEPLSHQLMLSGLVTDFTEDAKERPAIRILEVTRRLLLLLRLVLLDERSAMKEGNKVGETLEFIVFYLIVYSYGDTFFACSRHCD